MKNTIELTIKVKAPVKRIWQALSDYKEFGQWFKAEVSGPFVIDAHIDCRSTYPGHEHLTWEMKILRMETEHCFEFSWPAYYGEDVDRDGTKDPHLVVTFNLSSQNGSTLISLTETGFARLPVIYAATAYQLNRGGWEEQSKNIKAYLEH